MVVAFHAGRIHVLLHRFSERGVERARIRLTRVVVHGLPQVFVHVELDEYVAVVCDRILDVEWLSSLLGQGQGKFGSELCSSFALLSEGY